MKFYDSELKVMDLLWKKGELSAKQIADALNQSIGWNNNTSYTVIKKLVDKGVNMVIMGNDFGNYGAALKAIREETLAKFK